MKKTAILLTSLFIAFVTGCQDHNLEIPSGSLNGTSWKLGGASDDYGRGMAVDKNGNRYITGEFNGTMTLGETTLTSTRFADVFIAKLSSDGTVQWAQKVSGTESEIAYDVAVDDDGNAYIIGTFHLSITFGNVTLHSKGDNDVFFAKYNASGEFQWVKHFGSPAGDSVRGVTVDADGNILIVGGFQQTVNIDGTILTASGRSETFIAKYNSNGTLIWAKNVGEGFGQSGYGIKVDPSNNIYIYGGFNNGFGPAKIEGTTLPYSGIPSTFSSDGFIAKYSPTGVFQWVQTVTGALNDFIYDLDFDALGNVYATGPFQAATSFGPFTLVAGANEFYNVFVAKYSPGGNVQWVRQVSGRPDPGSRLVVDKGGTVIIAGNFGSTVTIDGEKITASSGSFDLYIARFNSDGTLQWLKREGGSGGELLQDTELDQNGQLYLYGYFYNIANLGNRQLFALGGSDIFIARYQP